MMEGRIFEEDAHNKKVQRRAGLYILNHFARSEAEELFDILGIPTSDVENPLWDINRWESALEQAKSMPDPKPQPKVFIGHSRPGEDNGSAKVNNDVVRAIRSDFDAHNYTTLKELGARYGVSRQTASSIGHRQTWGHVSEA
jgi:hypothetical protein